MLYSAVNGKVFQTREEFFCTDHKDHYRPLMYQGTFVLVTALLSYSAWRIRAIGAGQN
jgi:hypothetical protein